MGNFSISKAAFAGFALMARHPISVLVWLVIWILFWVGYMALGTYTAGEAYQVMAEISRNARESGTPPNMTSMMAAAGQTTLHSVVGGLFRFVVSIVTTAAVLRAALRPEKPGLAYLRLGGDEIRLLVTLLVVSIITVLAVAVPAVIGGIGAAVSIAARARIVAVCVLGVAGLVALAAMLFFAVKFIVATAITIGERKISIFESWSFAKGRFWPLAATWVLTLVVVIPVGALTYWGAASAALSSGASNSLGEAFQNMNYPAATPDQLFTPYRLAFYGLMALFITFTMVMFGAMGASVYQQLSGAETASAADEDDEDWDDDE